MGDDTIVRLFKKLDDLSERMARVETKIDEHNKYASGLEQNIGQIRDEITGHEKRINELEQAKAGASSIKEFIGWIAAVAATLWGWLKS